MGDRAYWDEHVEMTANVVDAIREQTYVLVKVNGGDVRMPDPLPRPGDEPAPMGSLTDFNALIEG